MISLLYIENIIEAVNAPVNSQYFYDGLLHNKKEIFIFNYIFLLDIQKDMHKNSEICIVRILNSIETMQGLFQIQESAKNFKIFLYLYY